MVSRIEQSTRRRSHNPSDEETLVSSCRRRNSSKVATTTTTTTTLAVLISTLLLLVTNTLAFSSSTSAPVPALISSRLLRSSLPKNHDSRSSSFSCTLRTTTTTALHQSSSTEVFDADKLDEARERQRWYHNPGARTSSSKTNTDKNTNSNRDDPEWKFFDTARIHVQGGDGGNGCVAFRREKGEARGGPNGGRGGRGGNVYLICQESLNTLMPMRQRVHVRAVKGLNGLGKNKDGAAGNDIYIPAPPGTVVRELHTQQLAGELRTQGQTLLVARGGRGGRGNRAFMTHRRTAPKLAERGEPGAARWLSIELRLVADVGFLGKPNAGKSTLLAAASAAKPKIADYPFTTIVPNLGVCDLFGDSDNSGEGGLVLCDIPGLIEGAAGGAGMGGAFLRHVQRCRVLLHVVDGTSEDPIGDFIAINQELKQYDEFLAQKPQVVILNKIDVPEVKEREQELLQALREAAGHSRVLSISAATTERVKELMQRLQKFVVAQPKPDLPALPEVDLTKAGLDYDSDDYEIISDPSYPGQWRISGEHMEQIAKMTHWEYPEAVERFGRQLEALGISDELVRRGAEDGDLIMIDKYDFEFSPGMKNPYIPPELLQADQNLLYEEGGAGKGRGRMVDNDEDDDDLPTWRPFTQGGYLDIDTDELVGFGPDEEWDLLLNDDGESKFGEGEDFEFSEDEVWVSDGKDDDQDGLDF